MAWKASPGYAALAALAISLGVAAFTACATGNSTGDEADPVAKACQRQCDCEKCGAADLQSCKDDLSSRRGDAKDKNCGDEFDTYVGCLQTDAECTEGTFDDSACAAADADLSKCMNPKPSDGGTGDGGGDGGCLTCGQYINAGGMGTLCADAQQTLVNLADCACNTYCTSDCANDLCSANAPAPPGTTCSTCLSTYCSTQQTACFSAP
jgi:hypothetical protein